MSDCLLCETDLRDAPVVNEMARHSTPQRSVECPACTLVQADPRPKPKELERYYRSGEYRRLYPATLNDLTPRDFGYQASTTRAFIEERASLLIRKHALTQRSTVYEEGCGAGHTMHALGRDIDCATFGSDLDPAMETEARSRGVMPLLDAPPVDLACAFHVMEHDLDPVGFAWLLSLKAKRGGIVHVEVPDVQRITGDRSQWFQWPHIVNFSELTLSLTLMRAGLDAVQTGRIGNFLAGWGRRGTRMRSYQAAQEIMSLGVEPEEGT